MMKGYIYTLYAGADPQFSKLTDPIFGKAPTLGACVPNIRRAVDIGDWIFAVSGRITNEKQFVVGGFKVKEKIDALSAFQRFPDMRLQKDDTGFVTGNVIVNADGSHNPLDNHENFERRIKNYIVGEDPRVFSKPGEVQLARSSTLSALGEIFGKSGNRVFDIIGRHRKMDARQVDQLLTWMDQIRNPTQ